jgi:hypothetical protein
MSPFTLPPPPSLLHHLQSHLGGAGIGIAQYI